MPKSRSDLTPFVIDSIPFASQRGKFDEPNLRAGRGAEVLFASAGPGQGSCATNQSRRIPKDAAPSHAMQAVSSQPIAPSMRSTFIGMAIRGRVSGSRRVPDPMGLGMGLVFYP
ncbi:hypothetical protein EJB05_05623, partial [Eragrostis curvula]